MNDHVMGLDEARGEDKSATVVVERKPPQLRAYPKEAAKLVKDESNIRLNLGCGHDYRSGFINVDNRPGNIRCDLCMDLNRALPWHTSSVREIYACHVLEHVVFWDQLLDEMYRVLKPGTGKITIRVPDLDESLRMYLQGECSNAYLNHKVGQPMPLDWRAAVFGGIEDQLAGAGHVMGFSWNTERPNDLGALMDERGFRSIERKQGYQFEIFVEARK